MLMKHPNFPERKPVEVSDRIFETLWRGKGWIPVNGTGNDITDVPSTRSPFLEEKTIEELYQLAVEMEVPDVDKMNRDELIKAIEDDPQTYA